MHENSGKGMRSLSQRSGVVLEVHGVAVILREDASNKKTKIAARRLRFAGEKGDAAESANSKSSPSPES
jgi:hypothetical protein